jgi:outer membrane protein
MAAMKRILPMILTALLIGALTMPQAQQKAFKMGFVNTSELLNVHPKGKEARDILAARNKELKEISDKLTPLIDKVNKGTATAADRQTIDVLQKSANAIDQRYTKSYNSVTDPITKDIDPLVAKIARAKGFSVVMSAEQAGQGLIVYADEDLNLTDEVIVELKKK